MPEGFLKITHELSDKLELMDEVFGLRALKALHILLPKLDTYEDPLNPDLKGIKNSLQYVRAIAFLVKKYFEDSETNDQAKNIVDETINFTEKVFPFLNPRLRSFEEAAVSIRHVCLCNEYNCLLLRRLLAKYGDSEIKMEDGTVKTISLELESYYLDLVALAREAEILT